MRGRVTKTVSTNHRLFEQKREPKRNRTDSSYMLPNRLSDDKHLPGFVKVLALVTDTLWSLVELKMALCPRQDPDGDPVTYVYVTHRVLPLH